MAAAASSRLPTETCEVLGGWTGPLSSHSENQGAVVQLTGGSQLSNFPISCFAFVFCLGEGSEWAITFVSYRTEGGDFVQPECQRE